MILRELLYKSPWYQEDPVRIERFWLLQLFPETLEHYECKESMVLAVPYHLRNWVVDVLALTY